ncbi:MAG TPA: hypothetical protein VFO39_04095 [Candidatus Sulfotelmatobacter sp.]|nr:hypothetical protein [Candidatus Sulfotelmatobacter sp.]
MARESVITRPNNSFTAPPPPPMRKPAGYGLPCAKCRRYYSADLEACPLCDSRERVSALAPRASVTPAPAAPDPMPDAAALEQEREEFLRQFKSQFLAAQAELSSGEVATCDLTENHSGEAKRAEVCRPCYDRLQERLDVYDASLHIDLKEATQIIYDAVWADPSDPGKTYQNAAHALLSELRKRAGMSAVLGPFQTLPD